MFENTSKGIEKQKLMFFFCKLPVRAQLENGDIVDIVMGTVMGVAIVQASFFFG